MVELYAHPPKLTMGLTLLMKGFPNYPFELILKHLPMELKEVFLDYTKLTRELPEN